jgi:hypothetical protein
LWADPIAVERSLFLQFLVPSSPLASPLGWNDSSVFSRCLLCLRSSRP